MLHSPAPAVSVCACSAIPEIVGAEELVGLPPTANAFRPTGLPTPVGAS